MSYPMTALVRTDDLRKTYETGPVAFDALKGVSMDIAVGDFIAVMGHSGSGKSTLLHLVGGLDRPTSGAVKVGDHELHRMSEAALARFRRRNVGFVFQFFNLIDNLTVRANVELPGLLSNGRSRSALRQRSDKLLRQLGIADQAEKHPWQLSGGQQQRVAIARALINHPTLLLVDEPTGNLDSGSSETVLDILDACHSEGQTILMVTHDPRAAARGERVLFLHDGRIVDQTAGGSAGRIGRRLAEMR